MTESAPKLETARLRLRAHRVEDFEACLAMWADPVVYRYIGGKPSTSQHVWSRVLNYAGHWSLLGFGYWAVERIDTGVFVGELGFADYKRDLASAYESVPELGWALSPAAHGMGFATEALRAAIAWGDVRFGSARTMCIIDPGNAASLRVAGKLGYRKIERVTYLERDTLVFLREAGSSA